jgi:threonine aldolase
MTSEKSFPQATRDVVDLRSDTVTRPTHEMFEAMQSAPLGDDVLGDDPTVMRLEELAAEMLGKEEALFVPSGTMGNQIAVAVHCRPGDAMLIEEEAHMLYYEGGSPALIGGVVSWTLPSKQGILDPATIEKRVLHRSHHTPGTTLLCLENTHNRAGGTVVPPEAMATYRQVADRYGMKIHLDGARVFNAAIALDINVKEIAQHVDTVNFCLSKGLRAPVGSLLCGPKQFIDEARYWRKRLGGGMRQSGLLAACGIVSLTKMVDRLADDHRRAKELASALARVPGFSVDMSSVQTNMVIVEVPGQAADIQERLKQASILALPVAANRLRLVLHADIDDEKLNRAIEVFCSLQPN